MFTPCQRSSTYRVVAQTLQNNEVVQPSTSGEKRGNGAFELRHCFTSPSRFDSRLVFFASPLLRRGTRADVTTATTTTTTTHHGDGDFENVPRPAAVSH